MAIKLVLDCFGGDKSPGANVEGAVLALKQHGDLSLVLTGDETAIKAELDRLGEAANSRIEIVHAPDVITGEDKPTDAIRLKRNSSMMKAIMLTRDDDSVSGMVSVGATGSLVAGSLVRLGRIDGIIRPAFCPILPTMTGGIVGVCDSGANVECVPEQLRQFALMGSLYMSCVFGIEKPRVALLNVGTESEKGDPLRQEAYKLLSATPGICFVGNMESRDLLSGKYDLVVCDGFSGNVLVKSTEGTALELLKKIKRDINSKFVYKLGALFMYRMFMEEKEFMNYQRYGGSVLLGANKTVVKGHGSSTPEAVAVCINQAYRMETEGLTVRISEAIGQALATTADGV